MPQHCLINLQAADKLKWGHQKGVYTVKEGYQQLCSRNPVIANWPWKLIWRTKLPPKTTYRKEKSNSQTDAICAKKRLKPPDTFFIVRWPQNYGACFFVSGINWTTPLTVKDAYESWKRNKRLFDGESTALGILKTRCTENLFSWTNLYPAVNAEQLQDFTNSLALA
ncbi:hypothetical protein H5410_055097 [Solanum commersonii]|uniref:Uncharacterized protein n=1 Tax=Solanum commersonii TaxID=4109 RepID=A0A9J5WGP6_SOLCO|nr:hypothetical protein H5410_055097 [Solanum commersonii]